MTTEGEKGETEQGSDTITLKVKDQAQAEMLFKVKKSTKMGKIMDAYAARMGVSVNSYRFTFDGQRLTPDTTPKMLEMEDEDQIEVQLEQVGGVSSNI